MKGFTADGKPIVDPGSVATREGIAACPGGGGGANFHAVSYNPVTKLFYVRVSDSCQVYTSHEDPLGARGNRWFGGGPAVGESARGACGAHQGIRDGHLHPRDGSVCGQEGRGIFRILAASPEFCRLQRGLVFLPGDGGLLVLDGKTGKLLRSMNLGRISSAGPMTYMVGGKQYIALHGMEMLTVYALH